VKSSTHAAAWAIPQVVAILAVALLAAPVALSSDDGRARGGTSCAGCHGGSATASLGVAIDRPGFDPMTLAPGELAMYRLTIEETEAGGALNVAIDGGATLGTVDANTAILSDELVHDDATTTPPSGNIGDWVYDFTIQVPMDATIGSTLTVSYLGMAFNGDGNDSSADIWNNDALVITVPEPAASGLQIFALAALALLVALRRRHTLRLSLR